VNWSEGGRRITWSYGPTLYKVSLDSVLAYWDAKALEAGRKAEPAAPGDTVKPPAPRVPTDTIDVALWLPRAKPSGTYAITNGRLVTMRGDEVVEDGTIVVEGNRITAVGPSSQVKVPAGARTFDARGRTIMPGMIDTHAHLHYNTLDILPEKEWAYWCNLAFGVTTTHDPSASTYAVFTQSEMVEAGVTRGPRTWSTGYILYGADGPGKATVNSLDDAKNHLKRMKHLGAFSVKSYMQPRREQRQWIIDAARAESMLVVPEGGGNLESNLSMVVDGHTSIEHALPVTPIRDDIAQLFGKSGTVETPTLLVAYGGLSGEHWFYQHEAPYKHEKLLRFFPRGPIDARSIRRPVMSIDGDWHHMEVAEGCKRILDRGGKVTLGAHGQLQGLGPHWELWGLTQGGISNHEALRCATHHGAWALGMDQDLGSLEVGKLADFVVMDRNPLENIRNTDSIRWVVKNGEVFEGDTMKQLWPVERPAPRFMFQALGGGQAKAMPLK
jgi:imidazolonepropionase-like amidohydrolase